MVIQDLEIHRGVKGELLKVLSGHEVAARSFLSLVEARCDPTHLALLVTQARRPKRRPENAETRKAEKQELKAMAVTLKRLARQTRAVLARRRHSQHDLLGCEISVSIHGFPRRTGNEAIHLWFKRWGDRVEKFAARPIPKLLLNPRDLQRLRLMEYIRASTGKAHYARVADLLIAAEAKPEAEAEAEAEVTEEYLKKIDARFRTNARKWRDKSEKAQSSSRNPEG